MKYFQCVVWVLGASIAHGADWPTFRGDPQRQGISESQYAPTQLKQRWVFRTTTPPKTAWPGPAKWDAFAKIRGLRAMRNYDTSHGVSAVGDAVYVSSSSDDSVTCLDAATGKVRWSFCAEGPVRIAPTVAADLVYVGSDDGHMYCLKAQDGSLVWKYRPKSDGPLILNHGRMISQWPCRTGVLVKNNTAYGAFSLLPWQPSYLCAVDAKSGKVTGPGRYVHPMKGTTFEGPMTASDARLIAPQGRVAPKVYDLKTGKVTGTLSGKAGGGSFVLIGPDNNIFHGPGNKTGWITSSDPNTCKPVATYKACSAMVVLGDRAYQLADHELTSIDAKSKKSIWKASSPSANTMVASSRHVWVGALDRVTAFEASSGKPVWHASVDGGVHELAMAGDMVLASTDEGAVYCFAVDGKQPIRQERILLSEQPASRVSVQPRTRVDLMRQPGMVNGWRFGNDMSVRAKRRGIKEASKMVSDRIGRVDGKILGQISLRQAGGIEAIELDGKTNSIMLAEDHKTAKLPTRSMAVEAWVRVDKTLKWGGIIGAFQDNGDFERGWLLGYKDSKFFFALNTKGGANKLTYLESPENFKTGQWYHVVGSYDGAKQLLFVNGKPVATETKQRGEIQYPPQAFFEMGAYHDKDEYFRMTGLIHEVGIYNRPLSTTFVNGRYQRKLQTLPKPIHLAAGPYVRYTDADAAIISWETAQATQGQVKVHSTGGARVFTGSPSGKSHSVKIDRLLRHRIYTYQIKTGSGFTPAFELDTSFNYMPDRVAAMKAAPDAMTPVALELLKTSKLDIGICLMMGVGDGRLAYQLVRQSKLRVIAVETDARKVAVARNWLKQQGVYGTRVAVHQVKDLKKLPFVGDFANLVICEPSSYKGRPAGSVQEYARMAQPNGGMVLIGQAKKDSGSSRESALRSWFGALSSQIKTYQTAGTWLAWQKPPMKEAGVWSHQYGKADNSAFGGESLSGATRPDDFRIQWLGRPGPRAQPDRNGRKPSPLATNGRLFLQGLHRLIGIDAFNGTILWTLEIPPLERFNIPRDSSNWCADENHLYVAIQGACWQIDAKTGQLIKRHAVVPGNRKDFQYDWSYLGREGKHWVGSAVKRASAYVEFWGNADAGWYDARKGPITFKVCSENLFALDPTTGRKTWTYEKGVILNSTITLSGGKVYFVECRHPKVKQANTRRIGMPELWQNQFLVAIDAATGSKLYEKPLDTADGSVVFYMAHGQDKLAIVSSTEKKYHVYGFDAAKGDEKWSQVFDWPGGKGDHGKAMNRPAIVGNRLYVRPKVLQLGDGKLLGNMPGGGCGTYAMAKNTAIYRSGSGGVMTLWGLGQGSRPNSWERLRPGCWLSTIPANGMLLSPEGGGGCSCGKWMETSIGFMPKSRL